MENHITADAGATEFDASDSKYAGFVTAVRRHSRGAACAPAQTTLSERHDWLLSCGLRQQNFAQLFEELIWRIIASGPPRARATIHIGTLHPQLSGYGYNFELRDGFQGEVIVQKEASLMPSYKLNPLYRVMVHGETVRVSPLNPADAERFPLI